MHINFRKPNIITIRTGKQENILKFKNFITNNNLFVLNRK